MDRKKYWPIYSRLSKAAAAFLHKCRRKPSSSLPGGRNPRRPSRSFGEGRVSEPLGGAALVKGVSRRIVVVKNPDPKIFEEAIFIIREDFFQKSGMGEEHVLGQAKKAADHYIRSATGRSGRFLSRLPAPFFAAAGAVATAAAWLAFRLVGVG